MSTDPTIFIRDSIFKFMYDHPTALTIPDRYINDYVTIYNNSGQTPLMYAVVLGNIFFVVRLLRYDVGKLDKSDQSALMYAYRLYSIRPTQMMHDIITLLEQYELNADGIVDNHINATASDKL